MGELWPRKMNDGGGGGGGTVVDAVVNGIDGDEDLGSEFVDIV